ncbi:Transmembrane protein [Quillaja saponaria]|uniref:Transmembrane protein n=1 Tax=Quillaja saponaria TaxID=32244 RepID=A0AAD7PAB6_QUISA|nr:Transmembrane protein [Quillaja saponaria]
MAGLVSILVIIGMIFPEIAGQAISSTSSASGSTLLAISNVSEPMTQSNDTVRVDPLNKFKKYRGGYDITDKHYWSSTIFTGVYGYAIGVLWLLCGLLYGGFLLINSCCCKSNKKHKKRLLCHKHFGLLPILLAIFFTLLAIVASGLVLGGNARFHSKAGTVIDIIIDTANEASETIYNTTGAMRDLESVTSGSDGTLEDSSFLTSTSEKLDDEAAEIERQAKKNRRLIDKGLKIVYVITTVIIVLNLVAVIALSVSGVLRRRRALRLLIIICWFMTVICWLFFGLYFFLEKFSSDTCTAIDSFQQDPYNNSLSSILPCDELLSAKPVLSDVSEGIYNLVNQVNENISSSLQTNAYPNLVLVCNPFSEPPEYLYQPENCPANSIRIGDIPEVLKAFTCSDANNGTCNGGAVVISDSDYMRVEAYTSSIEKLLDVYPGIESLLECQSVKDAFSEILVKHCKPLKKFVQLVWAGMVFLSVVMVLLVLLWTIKAHHEQKHHFSNGSVKPHSTTANILESGEAKEMSTVIN